MGAAPAADHQRGRASKSPSIKSSGSVSQPKLRCWEGYDEALLLYVLGLGSPTHPLPANSYTAWTATYRWEQADDAGAGQDYLYAGPLFIHQLSHVWIDFRDIQDAYMLAKDIDYFENSRPPPMRSSAMRPPTRASSPDMAAIAGESRRARARGRAPSKSTASSASSSTT